MISIGISDKTDSFDGGFLRHHFTRFGLGECVSTTEEVEDLCKSFCDEHSRLLRYHHDVDNSWIISNYAYEQISFNSSKKQIEGRMYHVTGYDGSRIDGDEGFVFTIPPKKKKLIIPLLIGDDVEGLFVRQQYEIGYNEFILIGNQHSLIPMPQFKGRCPFQGLRPPLVYRH